MPKNATFIERFWEKVEIAGANDCWLWTGAVKQPQGYGILTIPMHNRKQIFAHRLSAAIHFGMFSRKDMVCHTCGVRLCVNPAHLYLGDAKSNARDARNAGSGANQYGAFGWAWS